jgi:hypothetical protein
MKLGKRAVILTMKINPISQNRTAVPQAAPLLTF